MVVRTSPSVPAVLHTVIMIQANSHTPSCDHPLEHKEAQLSAVVQNLEVPPLPSNVKLPRRPTCASPEACASQAHRGTARTFLIDRNGVVRGSALSGAGSTKGVKLLTPFAMTVAQEAATLLDEMCAVLSPSVMREILSAGTRIGVPIDIPARDRVALGFGELPRCQELSQHQARDLALVLADTATMMDLLATIIDSTTPTRVGLFSRSSALERRCESECSKRDLQAIVERVDALHTSLLGPSRRDSVQLLTRESDRLRFFLFHYMGYDPIARLPFGFDADVA